MQVPNDSVSSDFDLSGIYASTEHTTEYAAESSVVSDAGNHQPTVQDSARKGGQTGWHWQMGTALTGTAIVSAGLALPFIGKQAITVPVGEFVPPEQTPNGSFAAAQANRQTSQQVALDQGEGISPQVGQDSQAAFSVSSNPGSNGSSSTRSQAAQNTAQGTVDNADRLITGQSILAQKADGSWSLSTEAATATRPASSSRQPASTQPVSTRLSAPAIVSQLAAAVTSSEPVCLGNSCRGLAYIQVQLPKAKKTVQDLQQQLDDFANQHTQGDTAAYQRVLSGRLDEVSTQSNRLAIELVETDRYVAQLEVQLATADVQTGLARNLLSADTGYQTEWLRLKQVERRLLAEYSKADIDATSLNQLYQEYEEQQEETYAAAEAVLGNYVMTTGRAQFGQSSLTQSAPAVLDTLQALTVSLHQQDTQQLRDSTLKIAEENLQRRQRTLAQDLNKYESLQQELRTATVLVKQYEQTRAQIETDAAAAATAPVAVAPTEAATATASEQASPAVEIAKTLEQTLPDGSLGKAILGVVIAAGAVAVATQRRSGGDAAKALVSLDVNRRAANREVPSRRALTGPATSQRQLAIADATIAADTPAADTLEVDNLAIEIMSRELDEILSVSTAESFEKEKQERAIASIQLPVDKIDAFAESAVRWVLKDLLNAPSTAPSAPSMQAKTTALSLNVA